MGFGRNFRFLVDISGNLMSVEFGRILGLVDFSRNLRLIDLSRFPRLRFRVRAIYYRAFLLITGGSK